MIQLLTDMWMGLAGAGVIGLVLGWAFRGAFLPRPKTVSVTPKSDEPVMSGLTEAQKQALVRAEQADAAVVALEARVKAAQQAAAEYQAELTEVKASLSAMQAGQGSEGLQGIDPVAALSEPVEEAAEPVAAEDKVVGFQNDPKLEWRNRYLGSRVRHLESQLEAKDEASEPVEPQALASVDTGVSQSEVDELKQELDAANAKIAAFGSLEAEIEQLKSNQQAAEARVEAALQERDAIQSRLDEAVTAEAESAEEENLLATAAASYEEEQNAAPPADAGVQDAVEFSKMKWQNKYLKARTLYLEESLSSNDNTVSAAPALSAPSEDLDALKSENTVLKAELSRVTHADNEAEKELTSLRWRNRYLEGRLKYLEAASLDAASEADDPKDQVAAALAEISRSVENEDEAPVSAEDVASADFVSTDTEVHADPVQLEVEETRPMSLDAPNASGPDDLKRIGGIGPKIEGILNELGIFHYDQIAKWTDAEVAWIDGYLRFQGRVQREKWVDQAASLEKAKTAS